VGLPRPRDFLRRSSTWTFPDSSCLRLLWDQLSGKDVYSPVSPLASSQVMQAYLDRLAASVEKCPYPGVEEVEPRTPVYLLGNRAFAVLRQL